MTTATTVARWEPAEKSRFSRKDMQVIGPELIRLKQAGVRLTPENIVAEARKKNSPLHPYYTWDADKAREKLLLIEAGQMLRSVKIIFEVVHKGQTKEIAVRAFHRVVRGVAPVHQNGDTQPTKIKNGKADYASLDEVLASQKLLDQVIARALNELRHVKKKFHAYSMTLPGFRQRLREAVNELFADDKE